MGDIKAGLPITITDAGYNGTSNTKKASVSNTGAVKVHIEETDSGLICTADSYTDVANNVTEEILAYTVPAASTFYVKSVIASASAGPCKVIIDYADAGVQVAILATVFFSSVTPFVQVDFPDGYSIPENNDVRVFVQKKCGLSQNVYATIMGRYI